MIIKLTPDIFKCWICNDKEIKGKEQFINHINEIHRRPNDRPDLTKEEVDDITNRFRVKPNTRRVKLFGGETDLVINFD